MQSRSTDLALMAQYTTLSAVSVPRRSTPLSCGLGAIMGIVLLLGCCAREGKAADLPTPEQLLSALPDQLTPEIPPDVDPKLLKDFDTSRPTPPESHATRRGCRPGSGKGLRRLPFAA